jgi:2-polyprenyl-6-hydroxyphenyl methylase / 3-demethylubiquinone-9 3-methyltransferase
MTHGASTTIDPAEVARFEQIAETWWDPKGPMKVLHKFNPVRLTYIRDEACRRFGRDPRSWTWAAAGACSPSRSHASGPG